MSSHTYVVRSTVWTERDWESIEYIPRQQIYQRSGIHPIRGTRVPLLQKQRELHSMHRRFHYRRTEQEGDQQHN